MSGIWCLRGVKQALDDGVDINIRDENGNTSLMKAVESRSLEIMEYLIDQGASLHGRNKLGETIIGKALPSIPLIKLLVERGADINAPTYYKNDDYEFKAPPLIILIGISNNTELINYFINSESIDVNAIGSVKSIHRSSYSINIMRFTPLHIAVLMVDSESILKLLEKGSNVNSLCVEDALNLTSQMCFTPLDIYKRYRRYFVDNKIEKLLIEHGAIQFGNQSGSWGYGLEYI